MGDAEQPKRGLLCRTEAAGLKWQVEQAARNLKAEKRRGEALARERESLAKLRAQAENATHTQVRDDGWPLRQSDAIINLLLWGPMRRSLCACLCLRPPVLLRMLTMHERQGAIKWLAVASELAAR
jgi:hypothetical protein